MSKATYIFENDNKASEATETIGREMGQGGYQGFTNRVEIYDVSDFRRACSICEACGGTQE